MFAKKCLTATALLCAIPFAGCARTGYYRVESDPPGAHVVNPDGTLICNAPCQASCTTNGSDISQPPGLASTLKAMPMRTQDCVQTASYVCDKLPTDPSQARTIFFDMKVCPINRSLTGTMSGE
jgi:hypothetical protein